MFEFFLFSLVYNDMGGAVMRRAAVKVYISTPRLACFVCPPSSELT